MTKTMGGLGLLALILTPGFALAQDGLPAKADQLITEAKKVQLEAMDISKELKVKNFAMDKVNQMLDKLIEHVQTVDRMTEELAPYEGQMTAQQKEKYEAVKLKAQLLNVFAKNKKDLLTGGDAEKNRRLLRAKADGIAQRADMLQQSAMALRR